MQPGSLDDRIRANRIREARRDKAGVLNVKLMLMFFDEEDEVRLEKMRRIQDKCKALLRPRWEAMARNRERVMRNKLSQGAHV